MLSDLHVPHFISLYLFLFAMRLKDGNYESHYFFSILQRRKNDFRFENVPRKNVWFCFVSIACVHLSHKTEKF